MLNKLNLETTWKKLKSIEYSSLYPLFFTIVFILILIQYSFSSLDAVFYDWWVRLSYTTQKESPVVLIVQDEESDQFLGETLPYTYATHNRLMENLIKGNPKSISYLINLSSPESLIEQKYQLDFKNKVQGYQDQGGSFFFGTDIEGVFGEILPPEPLRELGYSPAFLYVDSAIFSKDEVVRRAIINISGEESFHLKVSNDYLSFHKRKTHDVSSLKGAIYNPEADATFALFKYLESPLTSKRIKSIPFHQVVVGNFSEDFFKDKIVLLGSQYISNVGDYVLTPFSKDELQAPKLKVHANIISSFIRGRTIVALPDVLSHFLAIFLSIVLSFLISRVQPTKGLVITIALMVGVFCSGFALFSLFSFWLKLSHIMLAIFVVYYIWVPFRAIEEYQTRFAYQEETKILKQVDHLKQNFISLMSHDLKTPVAKISGIADILRHHHDMNQSQKELLDNIILATKELNSFISSILDLTKIESQNLTIKKESKDINSIIESSIDKLKFEASDKDIHIVKNLGPLYPIEIDSTLMKRVISNLIENAIKYSGKGSKVEIVSSDDEKWVYVEIKDNGVGIPPEDVEHIFDKFYRVKNDSTHAIKGTGLGLYLVKYFIELHDGEIRANSRVGEGTTFSIKLKNA